MSNYSYRVEQDLELLVQKAHVREAECRSVTRCTMAQAGQEAVGYPVRVAWDDKTGEVTCTWDAPDRLRPALMRHHRGLLRPLPQAIRLLLMTDTDKAKLVRQIPSDGLRVRIEEHRSRRKQTRTAEVKELEAAQRKQRRSELKALRAAGLAPPAVARTIVSFRGGSKRGLAATEAD